MAHEINYNSLKGTHSFVSNQQKAWHGLGQIVDSAMTAEEAITLANLDYEVAKTTVNAAIPDGDSGNVIYTPLKDRFATYRTDNGSVLGQVGSRYEIVQNKDAFGFFDSIIDSGEAIFETAGVLGNGERIFVTAKLPEDMLVGGEPCKKYIILTNSHDGSSSIIAGFTTVRIVCNNTLQAALGSLSNSVSIKHFAGAKSKLQEAYKVMGIASKYMAEVDEIFNNMAKTRISDEELKGFILNVMQPDYKISEDDEIQYNVSKRLKNQVDGIYNFALSHPTQTTNAAEGTVWGAYNAISGYYNYIAKFNSEEDKFKSQMFGNGNKNIKKAFNNALALTMS